MHKPLQKPALSFVLFVLAVSALPGLIEHAQLWIYNTDGVSSRSLKTPYWDFLNLWFGSHLAVTGQVDMLFDFEGYRAAIRALYGAGQADSEWSYPPSMLLIGAPLTLMPLPLAYAAWTAGGVGALYAALGTIGSLPRSVRLLVCLSPMAFHNSIFGQNGAYSAALLIAALVLAPRRPLLAGLLAGLLTLKPHLGLLIPVAWLAAGHWRAMVSAGLSSIALVVLTGLCFGFAVWPHFWIETRSLMVAIMEAPYPQAYHLQAMTVFIAVRALGGTVATAYGVQFVAALACAAVTFAIWRPAARIDVSDRICLTALMALIVTPYGYSYDGPAIGLAIAWLALSRPLSAWGMRALWPLWYFPYVMALFTGNGLSFFIAIPIGLAVALVLTRRVADEDHSQPANPALGAGLEASAA